jgi:hypothetical protein
MALAPEPQASTTTDVAALAQTRERGPRIADEPHAPEPGEGASYDIGPGVERAWDTQPYERRPGDPLYRPIRIFALDPAASTLDGSIAVVNVPYEPLKPGPVGSLFAVIPFDRGEQTEYVAVDPDDTSFLLGGGRQPAAADPLFHQQSVYAIASVVYATFRSALGRNLAWGFPARPDGDARLHLVPNDERDEQNAYYDKDSGELRFGYYRATTCVTGRNPPGGYVFTCLSHDIVAHEVTHALLDGLRATFDVPSNPDVPALHEALADLVAIFQRFSFSRVVESAIEHSGARLERASLLTDLATQFGQTIGSNTKLRSAIDPPDSDRRVYDAGLEVHELGSVLVSAVFEAFTTVFARKTRAYCRLASNGTGVLPAGDLPADLRSILAAEASTLASQFLRLCIRAVDYCPPVDVRLGDFLRAAITADHDLVPDDKWRYREAWIDAFWQREIYPPNVGFLSEDALCWEPPEEQIERIQGLTFASLRFAGDPALPANRKELRRQAGALGNVLSQARHLNSFGLAAPGERRLNGDMVDRPRVQSVRSYDASARTARSSSTSSPR